MDCTVRGVGRQLAEVEGLVHDSLPSEGCIAVYQDGHHLRGTGLRSQWVSQQSLVCKGEGKTWTITFMPAHQIRYQEKVEVFPLMQRQVLAWCRCPVITMRGFV